MTKMSHKVCLKHNKQGINVKIVDILSDILH